MLSTHLQRTTVRAAVALANRAPSVHNSQPWRWRVGPSSIHLFADPARALPATDPEGRDLRISCGAALHHLRVALNAAGLAARVHRMPAPAHPVHLAAVETSTRTPTPDDLALAGAIEHRRSDRRVFSTWPVPSEFLTDLVQVAERGCCPAGAGPGVPALGGPPAGRARGRRAGADPRRRRGGGRVDRPHPVGA